jgi:endonuclease/exonuclease/phosphatase family metal-dependent hydrolase
VIIFLKYAIWILAILLLGIGVFFFYSTITEYHPEKATDIYKSTKKISLLDSSLYSVLSWNIGYAGLGANMDFFYDGGNKMRDSKGNTLNNLTEIGNFLKSNDSLNFILLQEVDISSHRSYSINEKDYINSMLPDYSSFFGINYRVNFIPVPLKNPMGKVCSGIVCYSKHESQLVTRFSYPGSFNWPKRLFMPKRCFLESRFDLSNGQQFILINTHNTAFDDGSLRYAEVNYLQEHVMKEFRNGNYILIGGDWNQIPVRFKPNFTLPFDTLSNCYFPKNFLIDWNISYLDTIPTNRQLQSCYIVGKTLTTVIDYFISSPNIEIISKQVVDLKFKNTDHQPVILTFKFKR